MTAPEPSSTASVTAAWRQLAASLAEFGEVLPVEPFPTGTRSTTDGYRYLARLAVLGLQWSVEFGDPDYPAFYRHDDDITKWGGPNADNTYMRARVRGGNAYRVTGNGSTLHGFVISTHEGDMQLEQYGVYDEIWHDEVSCDAVGNFELYIGGTKRDGNWIPLDDHATNVTIRQYFNDWSRDSPGEFRIERIGGEGTAPAPLAPDALAERIRQATTWIESSLHYWNRYVDALHQTAGPNSITTPAPAEGGASDIAYGFGFFDLDDNQALVIEGRPPQAWFWHVMLYNLGWMESLDVANRTTSLNGHQMRVDDDGQFRVVISQEDPGTPNWLDPAGNRAGMIATRYIRSADRPPMTARLVDTAAVRDVLPASTPVITAEMRRAEITARQHHLARRFRR